MSFPYQQLNPRIKYDFEELNENPVEFVVVELVKNDAKCWNLIFSDEDRLYFGSLKFPDNYPWNPPTVLLCQQADVEEPQIPFYLPITKNWIPANSAREIIIEAKKVIWQFCKTKRIPLKNLKFLQADVFCEVMQCLSRTNVENCYMVCKSWKVFLEDHKENLPRRVFKSLLFDIEKDVRYNFSFSNHQSLVQNICFENLTAKIIPVNDDNKSVYDDYFMREKSEVTIASVRFEPNRHTTEDNGVVMVSENYEFDKIKSLAGSLFEEIVLFRPKNLYLYVNREHALIASRVLNFLKKVVEIQGEPLQAIIFRENIEENGYSICPSVDHFYPDVFQYVQAKEFYKFLLSNEHIDEKLVIFSKLPTSWSTINLSFTSKPGQLRLRSRPEEANQNGVELGKFLADFSSAGIEKRRFSLTAYCFSLERDAESVCEHYFNAYKQTDNLDKLPYEIIFYQLQGFATDGHIVGFVRKLFAEEKILEKQKFKHEFIEKMVFTRPDRWSCIMTIEYCENDKSQARILKIAIVKT